MPSLLLGLGLRTGTRAAAAEADVAALGPAFLFNFADETSLFVGRDGTGGLATPAGTSSIGMAFDKSRMAGRPADAFLASRPELVGNGTFPAGILGWSAINNAALSWSPGRIRVGRTDASPSPRAQQSVSGLTVGATYVMRATVLARQGAFTARISIGGAAVSDGTGGTGALRFAFVATATSHAVQLILAGSGGTVGDWAEFGEVSFREVPGLHHVALADNSRPVTALSGGRQVCRTDGVDDAVSLAFPAGTLSAASYYAMAIATADTAGSLVQSTDGTQTFGVFQGSTDPVGCTVTIGGLAVANAATARQVLLDALAATGGRPVVVELLDVPHGTAAGLNVFYNAGTASLMVSGDCYGLAGFAAAPGAPGRARVRSWLAGLAGVATR